MKISLATGEFERLTCTLSQGDSETLVTASNPEAATDLAAAIESAAGSGVGECFWQEGGGEYRWLFRRENTEMQVVVLWSTGTLTGWEHKFWARCDVESLKRDVRQEVQRLADAV